MGGVDGSDQMVIHTHLNVKDKKMVQKMWIHLINSCVFSARGRAGVADNPFRLVERHFPYYIPVTEKNIMPPNGVLFVKNVVSEKNHDMYVSGVMQHSVLLLVLKFITNLRYYQCLVSLHIYQKRTRNAEQ